MVAVMGDARVLVQDVFFLSTTADVMNDEWRAVLCAAIGDDTDVRQIAGQAPGDDVPRLVAV